ncbi:MAG: hypothetical protein AAFQ40_01400 [Cyanobacteria bacterium J06623_5]
MLDVLIYLLPFILGGLFTGSLCGLVPFFIAKRRRRPWLGFFALMSCALCGVILGILLAFPVAASFSVAILLTKPKAAPKPAQKLVDSSPSQRTDTFTEASDSEPQLD